MLAGVLGVGARRLRWRLVLPAPCGRGGEARADRRAAGDRARVARSGDAESLAEGRERGACGRRSRRSQCGGVRHRCRGADRGRARYRRRRHAAHRPGPDADQQGAGGRRHRARARSRTGRRGDRGEPGRSRGQQAPAARRGESQGRLPAALPRLGAAREGRCHGRAQGVRCRGRRSAGDEARRALRSRPREADARRSRRRRRPTSRRCSTPTRTTSISARRSGSPRRCRPSKHRSARPSCSHCSRARTPRKPIRARSCRRGRWRAMSRVRRADSTSRAIATATALEISRDRSGGAHRARRCRAARRQARGRRGSDHEGARGDRRRTSTRSSSPPRSTIKGGKLPDAMARDQEARGAHAAAAAAAAGAPDAREGPAARGAGSGRGRDRRVQPGRQARGRSRSVADDGRRREAVRAREEGDRCARRQEGRGVPRTAPISCCRRSPSARRTIAARDDARRGVPAGRRCRRRPRICCAARSRCAATIPTRKLQLAKALRAARQDRRCRRAAPRGAASSIRCAPTSRSSSRARSSARTAIHEATAAYDKLLDEPDAPLIARDLCRQVLRAPARHQEGRAASATRSSRSIRENAAGHYLKGEGLLAAGKLDEARTELTRASSADDDVQYFDALGRAAEASYAATNDSKFQELAIHSYTQATEADPTWFNPWAGLGRAHVARHEFTQVARGARPRVQAQARRRGRVRLRPRLQDARSQADRDPVARDVGRARCQARERLVRARRAVPRLEPARATTARCRGARQGDAARRRGRSRPARRSTG